MKLLSNLSLKGNLELVQYMASAACFFSPRQGVNIRARVALSLPTDAMKRSFSSLKRYSQFFSSKSHSVWFGVRLAKLFVI